MRDRRPLNATEWKVLETAQRLETRGLLNVAWNGRIIQQAGWPDAKSRRAHALGISDAIQVLKMRGFVVVLHGESKGWFRLTEKGFRYND